MSVPLIPLATVKSLLGLTDGTYDAQLTVAMPLVTTWFETYCDRGLARRTIVNEEIFFNGMRRLYLWAFPLASITSIDIDGTVYVQSDFLMNKLGGYITGVHGMPLLGYSELIKASYVGGYADNAVPGDLAAAYADACGGQAGVAGTGSGTGGGGGTIKSIGLGSGALSVSFDTSVAAQKGGITGAYSVEGVPTEVQNYASVLDYYVRKSV